MARWKIECSLTNVTLFASRSCGHLKVMFYNQTFLFVLPEISLLNWKFYRIWGFLPWAFSVRTTSTRQGGKWELVLGAFVNQMYSEAQEAPPDKTFHQLRVSKSVDLRYLWSSQTWIDGVWDTTIVKCWVGEKEEADKVHARCNSRGKKKKKKRELLPRFSRLR